MKVYYLSGSTFPSKHANSVQVMKMCQAFVRSCGHTVRLFGKGIDLPENKIFANYAVKHCFELCLSREYSLPLLTQASSAIHKWFCIRKQGLPDLFYARSSMLLSLVCHQRVGMILEVHTPPNSRKEIAAMRRVFRSPSFLGMVVITRALQEDIATMFPEVPSERIMIAPDGAEIPSAVDELKPIQPWPGRPNAFQVGYTGSLYAGRVSEILVLLAKRLPEMDFHIVGGRRDQIEVALRRARTPNIFFHGYVPHSKTQRYRAHFDVLLAPYQNYVGTKSGRDISRWTSPLKIFEYMSARKPIVASDIPVLHEVLQHEKNALLIPCDDLDIWISTLHNLQANPDERNRLGDCAYQDFKENYTWDSRARKISAVFGLD